MPKDLWIALFAGIVITAGLFFGVYQIEKAKCTKRTVGFEQSEHSFLGGCMVKHKGMWIPLDNVRGFD